MARRTPNLTKSLDDIRAEIFARMEEVQDDYAARGWLPSRLNLNKGIMRGIIELFAWGLWQLYQFLNHIFSQAVPLESEGDWLEVHAAQVDLVRKPALKARGQVIFSRPEGASTESNIRIAAGRIVRTRPDGEGQVYRFVTLADAVLPQGAMSVTVDVEAEEYGAKANAAQGQICEIVTPVQGVASVTNSAQWLTREGAEAESDASLQRRYVLAWQAQAGITSAAYAAAALSVPGVVDVHIADNHPRGEATVDVVVQGAAGLPTEALLELVRQAIREAIVINHDVLVKAPEPVSVDVDCVLELLTGDADATRALAESWIKALFGANADGNLAIPAFGIGKDVIRDRMASGIITLPGVKRIVWTTPTADITIAAGQLATLGRLAVRTAWAEEA